MTTTIKNKLEKINELEIIVKSADTSDLNGRQSVANSCKTLYNLIEEDVYDSGSEWMLKGLYNDLCNGNFAEPFMCNEKKNDFTICVQIYNDKILPRL